MVDVAQLFRWRCGVESPTVTMVNKGRKHAHAMRLFLQLFDGWLNTCLWQLFILSYLCRCRHGTWCSSRQWRNNINFNTHSIQAIAIGEWAEVPLLRIASGFIHATFTVRTVPGLYSRNTPLPPSLPPSPPSLRDRSAKLISVDFERRKLVQVV